MASPRRQRNRIGIIFLGWLVGLGLGLVFGWFVWPLEYVDAELAWLCPEQKDLYIALTGAAYGVNHDLARAQARLHPLQEPDLAARVTGLAARYQRREPKSPLTRGLLELAAALKEAGPVRGEP
jgi:hypothetical protein